MCIRDRSCIGYAAREIPAAGHDARPLEIRLQEQPQTPLSPVITHIPRKRYTFGRSIGSKTVSARRSAPGRKAARWA